MYLKHFGFNELPFSLTPNLRFFCNLTAYQEALNVVLVSLHNGEGFIKITGEVGTGKTMLCRKLLNTLGSEYITAYISNATLYIFNLQKAIAYEIGLEVPPNIDNHALLTMLTNKLIALHQEGKHVVIIVDEAHALSDQALEGLRLLSNLETETNKLIHIILVGQPELDRRLKQPHLRQLQHRIAFSYRLPTLNNFEDLVSYICFRLSSAGYYNGYDSLFSPKALKLLLKASHGIPRLVNILCHKSLLITYGYNRKKIDAAALKMAITDTDSVTPWATAASIQYYMLRLTIISLFLTTIIGVGSHFIFKLLPYVL